MRDHQNFETIIKNEKRKKWLKMIGTSSLVTVVVGVSLAFGVYTTLTHRMEKQAQQAVRQFNISDFIFSPNVKATTQHYTLTSATRATLTSEREKNIDGYHVAYPARQATFSLAGQVGANTVSYNMWQKPHSHQMIVTNRETQQKEPIFFNVAYPKWYQAQKNRSKFSVPMAPTHEAKGLSQLPNNLGEVALTFDKRYTYREILNMLPSNVMINYYWLGYHASNVASDQTGMPYIGLNANGDGRGELIDKTNNRLDDNQYVGYQGLKKALNQAEKMPMLSSDIPLIKDAKQQLAPDLQQAQFAGVIVTGRTENLAALDQLPAVCATNVGVTTPIMPYLEPLK